MLPSTAKSEAEAVVSEERITCGAVTLDPQWWVAQVNGRNVSLTVAEFVLLHELVRNTPRYLDRPALNRVLQNAPGLRAERVSLRAVDLLISRLRRKLQAAGCDAIETMRQVGYRFLPSPEPSASPG